MSAAAARHTSGGNGAGVLLLIVAAIVVSYLVSLRWHPLRRCGSCSGTGRHFGAVYTYAQRRCRTCAGSGRRERLGVRVLSRRQMN
jgi:DnaJ-class molecular chaperone